MSCAISQAVPAGSVKAAVRLPHARSTGPLSMTTPRSRRSWQTVSHVLDPQAEQHQRRVTDDRRGSRCDDLGSRPDLEHVEQGPSPLEDGRHVVAEDLPELKDVAVERAHRPRVLDEQGQRGYFDFTYAGQPLLAQMVGATAAAPAAA